jgi:hypothetical protein
MKIKTSELKGAPLNWAVAQIRQLPLDDLRTSRSVVFYLGEPWMPDIYWEQGGVIIEEEKIALEFLRGAGDAGADVWVATRTEHPAFSEEQGLTPLTAAMRCYVASQLGDEVDVPDELSVSV